MNERDFGELLKKINLKICGINGECIEDFINELNRAAIDFNTISMEWVILNIIREYVDGADIDEKLFDSFVDERYFVYQMAEKYGVVNPLIYKFAKDAASRVTKPLVTKESKLKYLDYESDKAIEQLYSAKTEEERQAIQSKIDYLDKTIKEIVESKHI